MIVRGTCIDGNGAGIDSTFGKGCQNLVQFALF